MGITGLHGLLKSIQKPCNLRKFKGQTFGVDAYGWLHRGTVACAIDLALDKHNTKYVDFAMNRVRMLLYFGVTPYLVFDGDHLPSKAGTETARAQRREESKKLGLELYRSGRVTEAHQELQKAVDVTPYMARLMIEELKKLKIQYVVAPYEADAQLVYLEKQGMINGIISEDSDLLVFGAKRLLSKLDKHGDCVEINRGDFTACRDISLIGWTDADFRLMCILSGCDYLANLPKMGLKTAYRNVRKYKTVEKILKMLQFEGNGARVPPQYLEDFKRAELTFLHQLVFCPLARKLVTLSPLPEHTSLDSMPFVGAYIEPDTAIGVACGDLDPITKEPINLQPSYPERSRLLVSRRQTLPSTTDLKQSKPIDSFFTPKRVPLGELDPNSLTPSPSQQRLIEANARRSWVASSVPTRGNVRRATSSFFPPNTASPSTSSTRVFPPRTTKTPLSSDREKFLASASTVSKFQPVKRQRLCSDADEAGAEAAAAVLGTEKRSRFFAGAGKGTGMGTTVGAKSSGSAGISNADKARTKKAKRADFGVFSDNVVEDIMLQLPDGVSQAETRDADGVNNMSEDGLSITQSKIEEGGESIEDIGSSIADALLNRNFPEEEPTATTTGLTQAMTGISTGGSDSQLSARMLEYEDEGLDDGDACVNSSSCSLGLRDKFGYVESNRRSEADHGTAAGNEHVYQNQHCEGEVGGEGGKIEKSPAPHTAQGQQRQPSRMTALQRLGQSALYRSKSMGSLRTAKTSLMGGDEKDNNKGESEGVDAVDDDGGVTPSRSGSCYSRPGGGGERCLSAAMMKHQSRGSEDLIIPDSEGESEVELEVDVLNEGEEKGRQTEKGAAVDFKQFLFTGSGSG
ncbi:exonuclease 1 [Blastomyces dermatitidis ER-3]|uniref:Exonuclease 1 n=1 Tax=Ajellomyces dermatitidis (strain ER-3 / ATCC MYA-2586) TaxID=559297 RepID=A0ABP2F3D4_AJEDR|nr:exonuclease 1 [Blastomyces dermatitidis ER-3]EEQ91394.1 exonuclease 1 [Blastomyces dermatitidis ER-3]